MSLLSARDSHRRRVFPTTPEAVTSETMKDGALVPATQEEALVFRAADTRDVWTSLPRETPAEKARIVSLMLAGDTEDITAHANEVLDVVHVLAHRVTVENVNKETGEVTTTPAVRTVLVCKDGKTYGASGNGVRDSVRVLAGFFGKPPWTEGLKVKPRAVKTRQGFTTYVLEPVVEASA